MKRLILFFLLFAHPSWATTNLVAVLQQTDFGQSSGTGITTKDETRIPIDTANYDGSVTYVWSIVATNADTSDRTIYLVDASGATIISQLVPLSTSTATRYSNTFTPNSNDDYRIKFDATTSTQQLRCHSTIYITQVGATKTRLQIPLVASANGLGSGTSVDLRASATYGQASPIVYSYWPRTDSAWATVAATGYQFEAVMHTGSSGDTAYASLFNVTDGTQVTASELTHTGNTTKTLKTSSGFAANATNFADAKNYEVRIKNSNGATNTGLHRACLYITLNPITKGESYYRVGNSASRTSAQKTGDERQQIVTNSFSNPICYHESTLYMSAAGTADDRVFDAGTSDTATTGSNVGNSTLTAGGSKAVQRSGAITLTSGNRYIYNITRTSGTIDVSDQCVVVAFTGSSAVSGLPVLLDN